MPENERVTRLEERLQAALDATTVAKHEVDRRLDEMNLLRHQIESERGAYVTVVRYEERHEDLARRVSDTENRISAIEGGNLMKTATIGWLLAALGVFVTLVIVIVNIVTGA
jgi:hypothetical protein